jgi:hypothetical protein
MSSRASEHVLAPTRIRPVKDFRDRAEALCRLLARHPRPAAMGPGQTGASPDSTMLRNLLDEIPEDRLRALSAELRSRTGLPELDAVDGLLMRLLLDDYREAVRRFRAATRITEEKLRALSADVREARHMTQRELDRLSSPR